jgi:hypothetical protein
MKLRNSIFNRGKMKIEINTIKVSKDADKKVWNYEIITNGKDYIFTSEQVLSLDDIRNRVEVSNEDRRIS